MNGSLARIVRSVTVDRCAICEIEPEAHVCHNGPGRPGKMPPGVIAVHMVGNLDGFGAAWSWRTSA